MIIKKIVDKINTVYINNWGGKFDGKFGTLLWKSSTGYDDRDV